MLIFPKEASPYMRVMSIDPGTRTLGIAIWEIDISDLSRKIIFSHTLKTDKMIDQCPLIVKLHGEKLGRLKSIEDELVYFMQEFNVSYVVSESPYFRRMVTAFQALVECILAIRNAVLRYNPFMEFHMIDPSSVKNAVGVKGGSSDKSLMKTAVLKEFSLQVNDGVDLTLSDEHAIDAIAVGKAFLKRIGLWEQTPT